MELETQRKGDPMRVIFEQNNGGGLRAALLGVMALFLGLNSAFTTPGSVFTGAFLIGAMVCALGAWQARPGRIRARQASVEQERWGARPVVIGFDELAHFSVAEHLVIRGRHHNPEEPPAQTYVLSFRAVTGELIRLRTRSREEDGVLMAFVEHLSAFRGRRLLAQVRRGEELRWGKAVLTRTELVLVGRKGGAELVPLERVQVKDEGSRLRLVDGEGRKLAVLSRSAPDFYPLLWVFRRLVEEREEERAA